MKVQLPTPKTLGRSQEVSDAIEYCCTSWTNVKAEPEAAVHGIIAQFSMSLKLARHYGTAGIIKSTCDRARMKKTDDGIDTIVPGKFTEDTKNTFVRSISIDRAIETFNLNVKNHAGHFEADIYDMTLTDGKDYWWVGWATSDDLKAAWVKQGSNIGWSITSINIRKLRTPDTLFKMYP